VRLELTDQGKRNDDDKNLGQFEKNYNKSLGNRRSIRYKRPNTNKNDRRIEFQKLNESIKANFKMISREISNGMNKSVQITSFQKKDICKRIDSLEFEISKINGNINNINGNINKMNEEMKNKFQQIENEISLTRDDITYVLEKINTQETIYKIEAKKKEI